MEIYGGFSRRHTSLKLAAWTTGILLLLANCDANSANPAKYDNTQAINKNNTSDDSSSDVSSSGDLEIAYDHYKIEVGHEARFECTSGDGDYESSQLSWLNPNQTAIASLNDTRFSDVSGVLTITDVIEQDSGHYTCVTDDEQYSASVELYVYIMPDYFVAGMVMLAINCVLIVVFCACFIVTSVRERRETRRYKQLQQRVAAGKA